MTRLVSISIGFLLLLSPVLAPPGHAQTPQQRQWCDGQVSPDQQISGCTAIIESASDELSMLATAFNNRASAYFSQGLIEQAIRDLDQAVKLNPNYAHAFVHRGMAYRSMGQYDRAIQDFDQAIKLEPNYTHAFAERGSAYSHQGQHQRAIQDFDQAIKLEPNYTHAFVERGSVYSHQGQHQRAIQDFDQAIRLDPASGRALNDRCLSRATLGQLQEALADCNNALWLRRRLGRAITLNVRGIVYLKMNQFESAIADFDEALTRAPNNPSSLYGRGLAKIKKGDEAGGNADIKAARAIKADIADQLARYEVR